MNDFLSKPLDPDQLRAALLRWLKDHEAPVPVASLAPPAAEETVFGAVARLRRCLGEISDIDLDSGLERVQEPERYINYLLMYVGKYETSFAHMRELLRDGKSVEASGLAHALKGASAQLSVVGIQKQAALLENAINSEAEDGAIAALLKQAEERSAAIWASIHRLGDDANT